MSEWNVSTSEWNVSTIEPDNISPVDLAKYQIEYLRGKGIEMDSWDESIVEPAAVEAEIQRRRIEYLTKLDVQHF